LFYDTNLKKKVKSDMYVTYMRYITNIKGKMIYKKKQQHNL